MSQKVGVLRIPSVNESPVCGDGAIPTPLEDRAPVGYFHAMQRLDLSNSGIVLHTATRVTDALQNSPGLRELNLNSNLLGTPGAAIVADALASVPNLRVLQIADNSLGAAGLQRLLRGFAPLRLSVLNLSANRLGEAGIAALDDLPAGVVANLSILQLADNGIDDHSLPRLVSLMYKMTRLRVLDLSNNRLSAHAVHVLEVASQDAQLDLDLQLWGNGVELDALARYSESGSRVY